MFEVIPNWHPMFVHFPIALLTMSTLFFVLLNFTKPGPINSQIKVLAYWNLWIGTTFAVVTAIAGWFAYNSVAHDTPSHNAMTDHRNWAIVTVFVFIIISFWSIKLYTSINREGTIFTLAVVMAFILLASTGWRGSEAVYRYGLGVMSMPQAEGDGHAHEHASEHNEVSISEKNELKSTHHDSLDKPEHHEQKNGHDHSSHTH